VQSVYLCRHDQLKSEGSSASRLSWDILFSYDSCVVVVVVVVVAVVLFAYDT
jgi:heme/copper-type cytochrome/quinol oxidase subunit 2